MKIFVAISGVIAALMVVIVFVSCRVVDPSKADFGRDVSAQLGDTTILIHPDEPLLSEIRQWIQTPSPSWKRSITTYAPNLIIRNSRFTLNLLDHVAVLHFQPDPSIDKWIQAVRNCNTMEIRAIQALRAKIKDVEQVTP